MAYRVVLRSLERHTATRWLRPPRIGKAPAGRVVSFWALLNLFLIAPLVITSRVSAPHAILLSRVFASLPVWRAGHAGLNTLVRQRYAPGVGTDERRDVDALHMG